jgi:hypothetical protein
MGVTTALLTSAAAQSPAPAQAATQGTAHAAVAELRDELARLRQQFESLRDDYQKRVAEIESRLGALEAQPGATGVAEPPRDNQPAVSPPAEPPAEPEEPAGAPPLGTAPAPPQAKQPGEQPAPSQPAAQVPPGAAGAGGPEGNLPVYGNTSALSKIFNPDLAVIGNFIGAAGENVIDNRPALSMDEAEFSFQAVVDPYARADFFVAAGSDEIELEEGYLTLTALPGGVLAKIGKMKAQFGRTNTLHPHQLPWVDQPLVLQNVLGSEEGLNDSGVSVSKLLLNPWIFLEATGEVYKGDNATFRTYKRSDVTWLGRLRGYRDITESTNLDLGTSIAFGRNELDEDSRTRLFGLDATFRYRPLRRATYRRLLARTEFMWNRASTPLEGNGGDEVQTAFGMYVGGEYQFARRWFAGARYDYAERALQPSLEDKGPSALLTFWPSEFSQVRGQFRRIKYAEGHTANEVLFQFLFSIGAHGAHIF